MCVKAEWIEKGFTIKRKLANIGLIQNVLLRVTAQIAFSAVKEKWLQSETILHHLVFFQFMTVEEYIVYKYGFGWSCF